MKSVIVYHVTLVPLPTEHGRRFPRWRRLHGRLHRRLPEQTQTGSCAPGEDREDAGTGPQVISSHSASPQSLPGVQSCTEGARCHPGATAQTTPSESSRPESRRQPLPARCHVLVSLSTHPTQGKSTPGWLHSTVHVTVPPTGAPEVPSDRLPARIHRTVMDSGTGCPPLVRRV